MPFPWAGIIQQALNDHATPFYLSAWAPIEAALSELATLETSLPLKHWLSFKSHPVAPLIREWLATGRGIEVVSEYELLAATKEGCDPARILINGVGKHAWLPRHRLNGIWVHFDSVEEVRALVDQAKALSWKIGIRCHVKEEYDPDEPTFSGQFGMTKDEIANALVIFRNLGMDVQSLHFHLRSNVTSADSYRRALEEVCDISRAFDIAPVCVGCGGGLPVEGERSAVQSFDSSEFDLSALKEVLRAVPRTMPSVREIWMENGRFVSARSAVLVVRVIDIKERPECRYLICDGGRTNHALVSDWEIHNLLLLPPRTGAETLTTICGPTCMAFDRLARTALPVDVRIGDYVIWMNAGAYHIPWETRFSHGLAKVLWYDDQGVITVARDEENFEAWWSKWK